MHNAGYGDKSESDPARVCDVPVAPHSSLSTVGDVCNAKELLGVAEVSAQNFFTQATNIELTEGQLSSLFAQECSAYNAAVDDVIIALNARRAATLDNARALFDARMKALEAHRDTANVSSHQLLAGCRLLQVSLLSGAFTSLHPIS